MTSIHIILGINPRSKSIPYAPEDHGDSQNLGFQVLKGHLDKIQSIQEASDNEHIQEILGVLNAAESPFFSVGCEKSFNRAPEGFWAKGYIEFAFNFKQAVADAKHYFPMFFHFSEQAIGYAQENGVQYMWELQPAYFADANVTGFSCCTWVTTSNYPTPEQARNMWHSSVSHLSGYLRTVKIETTGLDPIY